MNAIKLPKWNFKFGDDDAATTAEATAAQDATADAAEAKLQPQRIPTFDELAEALPNLKRDLR